MRFSAPGPAAVPASGIVRALARLSGGLAGLAGWRRWALGFALGAAAALGFAPFHQVWLWPLAFPGLLWLLDGCRNRRAAFALGWAFGFGHMLVGLYWVTQGIVVFSDKLVSVVPIVLFVLPGGLALFIAAAVLATWMTGWRGVARWLAFAVFWAIGEWLRGHVLSGFPWNLAGYIWTAWPALLQSAALIGAYGLSLLTVLLMTAPALLADGGRPQLRRGGFAVVAGAVTLAGVWAGGAWRLAGAEVAWVPDVRLRIVQPSIPQQTKWEKRYRAGNFAKHLALSRQPAAQPVTHIIWPETAAAFLLQREVPAQKAIAAVTPPGGVSIVGAPRLRENPLRLWNSLFAIDERGAILAHYDKTHLVPLGEYVPLRAWLPLVKVVWGKTDYTPGAGRVALDLPGLPPFSPLICYEAIFPGAVRPAGKPVGWLLNLTNDAWFGTSTGPHQHLAIARLRAVEEGLPIVRAASTGISAVVDPYGRVLAQLGLQQVGVLDSGLPAALPGGTLYARFGDRPYGGLLLLLGALAVGLGRRSGRRQTA